MDHVISRTMGDYLSSHSHSHSHTDRTELCAKSRLPETISGPPLAGAFTELDRLDSLIAEIGLDGPARIEVGAPGHPRRQSGNLPPVRPSTDKGYAATCTSTGSAPGLEWFSANFSESVFWHQTHCCLRTRTPQSGSWRSQYNRIHLSGHCGNRYYPSLSTASSGQLTLYPRGPGSQTDSFSPQMTVSAHNEISASQVGAADTGPALADPRRNRSLPRPPRSADD